MSQVHFAKMPNISIPRTKMKTPFTHKMSFNFADIVPVMCREVLPGDTFRVDFAALIRMSTPIAPIMDNIRGSYHAFFVPMRLVWEHTEEFYGANKTSAGPQLTAYTIPSRQYGLASTDRAAIGSVSDYLGKPVLGGNITDGPMVSVLKERAYWLTINEWYRAQQVQNPWLIRTNDTGVIGTRIVNGVTTYMEFNSMPAKVTKQFDYFTACTISPQYGQAVTIPLGSYAPVVAWRDLAGHENDDYDDGYHKISNPGFSESNSIAAGAGSFYSLNQYDDGNDSNTGMYIKPGNIGATDKAVDRTNLYADLSNATAATINTLRYAFQVQKYLERSSFGSRFFEMLNAHYGVSSPDARLQRPEHLGEFKFNINVNQVLSTADASTGVTTKLGVPGANSTTAVKGHLFRKAFVEPGYILVLLSTYQDHTYSQGILREDLRQTRFEFYSPEFANLGDMPVYKNEIRVDSSQVGQTFGYQEHWAEYRYMPDLVSGLLNPNVSNTYEFWTLADKFSQTPTLSESFIVENRDNIARALTTATTGPDFIGDFYFDITAVRPMPAYTIPGLIDHFGTR